MAEDRREKQLAGFLPSMPITDGASQAALVEWLERAAVVVEYVPGLDILSFKRFLVKTSTGSLLQEVRSYDAEHGTPAGMVTTLRQLLVDGDEAERHSNELDNYRQAPYQSVSDYIAQFRFRFNRVYDIVDMQNAKLRQRLIRQFVNGLKDEAMRLYVAEREPATMEAAYGCARLGTTTHQWVRHDLPHGRGEEPMEVDALPPPPKDMVEAASKVEMGLKDTISQVVAAQLKGFQKQLGQIMKRLPTEPPAGTSVSPNDARRGTMRCYGCGEIGHVRRNCPQSGNGQRPPRQW